MMYFPVMDQINLTKNNEQSELNELWLSKEEYQILKIEYETFVKRVVEPFGVFLSMLALCSTFLFFEPEVAFIVCLAPFTAVFLIFDMYFSWLLNNELPKTVYSSLPAKSQNYYQTLNYLNLMVYRIERKTNKKALFDAKARRKQLKQCFWDLHILLKMNDVDDVKQVIEKVKNEIQIISDALAVKYREELSKRDIIETKENVRLYKKIKERY